MKIFNLICMMLLICHWSGCLQVIGGDSVDDPDNNDTRHDNFNEKEKGDVASFSDAGGVDDNDGDENDAKGVKKSSNKIFGGYVGPKCKVT